MEEYRESSLRPRDLTEGPDLYSPLESQMQYRDTTDVCNHGQATDKIRSEERQP